MADDALKCFESLLETVPGWIADLESILKTAAERQEEILFANQPPSTSKAPSQKASNSSSLRSRLSRRSPEADREKGSGKPDLLRPRLKHLLNSDALRVSQRKRKSGSVCSGDQSGPCKFRNKIAAVVYYDGDTQKKFEKLVRAIGTSRNAIRKGKMSVKVDSLSRTGSSSSEASSSGGEDGDFSKALHYRSSRARLPAFSRSDGSEAFDRVDGRMEKAQALCERAAHQTLRDGDCTTEVTHAKEHFAEALRMAKAELPALRKKAAKAQERHRREEERQRADEEAQAKLRAADPALNKTLKELAASVTLPSEANLEVDELEVDDESEDETDFTITALQFGKFSQMRQMRSSPRLAAH